MATPQPPAGPDQQVQAVQRMPGRTTRTVSGPAPAGRDSPSALPVTAGSAGDQDTAPAEPGSVQHRDRDPDRVVLIQPAHQVAQRDRHPGRDARRQRQDLLLARRARQAARPPRGQRRLEVHRHHRRAGDAIAAGRQGSSCEVGARRPGAVPDQQLNRCLQAQQAPGPYPHRGRKVVKRRSVSLARCSRFSIAQWLRA